MRAEMKLARRFLGMVLLAGAIAACDDDPVDPGHDDGEEVSTIRLTIGTQVLNIVDGQSTGTATVSVGTTPVSVVFLADDGDTIDLHADEFEIRITPAAQSGLTFTRTSAFAGNLQATSTGTKTLQIILYHLEASHAELGPYMVTVIVQ